MKNKLMIPTGGLIVIICFFLPWVKACGIKVSGYDLASDQDTGDPIFWLILLAGAGVLGAFYLAKQHQKKLILISSIFGLLILLIKYIGFTSNKEESALLSEIVGLEIGGYGTILGFLLSLIGSLITEPSEYPKKE